MGHWRIADYAYAHNSSYRTSPAALESRCGFCFFNDDLPGTIYFTAPVRTNFKFFRFKYGICCGQPCFPDTNFLRPDTLNQQKGINIFYALPISKIQLLNIETAGITDEILVQVAYAIGKTELLPNLSITNQTAKVKDKNIKFLSAAKITQIYHSQT